MKKLTKNPDSSRRDFLRGSVAAGAGASIVATVPGAALAAQAEQEPDRPVENYRLTRHIADYYKSAV